MGISDDDTTLARFVLRPVRDRPPAVRRLIRRLSLAVTRKFWLVALFTVTGFIAAFVAVELTPPLYRAESLWRVNLEIDPILTGLPAAASAAAYDDVLIKNHVDARMDDPELWLKFNGAASKLLGNERTAAAGITKEMISYVHGDTPATLRVSVTHPSPALAREAANVLPAWFTEAREPGGSETQPAAALSPGGIDAGSAPVEAALRNLMAKPEDWPSGLNDGRLRAQHRRLTEATARKDALSHQYQLPPDEVQKLNSAIAAERARLVGLARSALETTLSPSPSPSISPTPEPSSVTTPAVAVQPQPSPAKKPAVAEPADEETSIVLREPVPTPIFPYASIRFEMLRPALVPAHPIRPRRNFTLALGSLAGGIIGMIVAGLVAFKDEKIVTARDVTEASGLEVLGLIPRPKEAT